MQFAGWTYGLVLGVWLFSRQCQKFPENGELYCGDTGAQWSLIFGYLFLLTVGLLVGRPLLERVTGVHQKSFT